MGQYLQAEVDYDELPEGLRVVYDYWDALRTGRFAPSWQDFDLLQMPSSIIPDVHVADIVPPETGMFRSRFWGTNLTRVYCQDNTNKTIRDLQPSELADTVHNNMLQVVETKQPKAYLSEIALPLRMERFQYLLRLPLSDDGVRVHHIVTSLEYIHDRLHSREIFGNQTRPTH